MTIQDVNKRLFMLAAVAAIGIAMLVIANTHFSEGRYFIPLILVGIFTFLIAVLGIYEGLALRRIFSQCPECKTKNSIMFKDSEVPKKIFQCTHCQTIFDYSEKT
jgi:hypothetical protein